MAYKPTILTSAEGGTGASNTATSGKILIGDGTNFISSTPTYPNTSGTAGKVLVSDGTNNIYSTPTFPNASATSGKIIKSDGTNWVASTETYAVPGTSGNVLTSDGTNWTSAPASTGGILTASGGVTNTQVKNIHGTPFQVVAAPGNGKAILVINATVTMNYGGTNVFTAGAGQTISLFYGTSINSCSLNALSNSQIVAAASQCTITAGGQQTTYANVNNAALNLYNSSATEISGNAANDNTLSYNVLYRIVTIP